MKHAAAAAKSLQSCPNLCDPIDGSPPGSPVPGILQARTLEWGSHISFNSGFLSVYGQQWDFWVVWQLYFQFFKESPYILISSNEVDETGAYYTE